MKTHNIKNIILWLIVLTTLTLPGITAAQDPLASLNGQVREKAHILGKQILGAGKSRVVALDVTTLDGKTVTELGRWMSELLNLYLIDMHLAIKGNPYYLKIYKGNIVVVDRLHLENVLKEQKLNKSGLFNPELSSKVGELAGVEAIIIGTITERSDELMLLFKVIDVETATNIGGEMLILARSQEVNRMFSKILSE